MHVRRAIPLVALAGLSIGCSPQNAADSNQLRIRQLDRDEIAVLENFDAEWSVTGYQVDIPAETDRAERWFRSRLIGWGGEARTPVGREGRQLYLLFGFRIWTGAEVRETFFGPLLNEGETAEFLDGVPGLDERVMVQFRHVQLDANSRAAYNGRNRLPVSASGLSSIAYVDRDDYGHSGDGTARSMELVNGRRQRRHGVYMGDRAD